MSNFWNAVGIEVKIYKLTDNIPTKTKKKVFNVESHVKSHLRISFVKSALRNDCIKNARVCRGQYKCNLCGFSFKINQIDVDHVIPIGKFFDFNSFVSKLFCDQTNLQVLCKKCHKLKTWPNNSVL
jgi:5-methylcytosine-specific restriction endonuclease McrA